MMTPRPTDDRLYRLLPAIYRIRDAAQGEPLRALLAVIQQELEVVEADIDTLYNNWFIETCQDWVVPYIGDLLDVQELDAGTPVISDADGEGENAYGQQERRAYVANTLSYRRRKGTMPVLEQLTQDVTGWRSRAVEFGRLVSITQNLSHIHPDNTTVDLGASERLEQIGTPFEQQVAYSVDIRPVSYGGRYNLPNVGLYVWRLQSYPLERGQARAVKGPAPCITGQYYTFNPVGSEQVPLFNQPQTKANITTLASEINVSAVLRRPVLADELARRRQDRSEGKQPRGIRYFDTDPVLQVFLNGQPWALPPEAILIADLIDPNPPDSATDQADILPWLPADNIPWDGSHPQDPTPPPAYLVAVDPERGRLVVRPGLSIAQVEVGYFYGFSGDVGGGAYNRIGSLPIELEPSQVPISPWHWSVGRAASPYPNPLALAIAAWNRTVLVRYGLRKHIYAPLATQTHVPLALIQVAKVEVVQAKATQDETLPMFKPGRIRGLEVELGICPNHLEVRSGLAVDQAGQRLSVRLPWCFDVVERFCDTIRQLPDRTRILVLYYKPGKRGNSVDLGLVTEATLNGYPPGTVIPLKRLYFDESHNLQAIESVQDNTQFRAGILQGLAVYTRPGTLETFIKPGIAVDDEGYGLVLAENYPLDLTPYQGGKVKVLAVPAAEGDQRIRLVSAGDTTDLPKSHIPLAQLDVPAVEIANIETRIKQLGFNPAPDTSETDASTAESSGANTSTGAIATTASTPTPDDSSPTTIQKTGLGITVNGARIEVAAGTLQLLPSGQTFRLASPQSIDLSAYAGRTLLLFLSDQPDQGWPLNGPQPADNEDSAYLGMIPVAPPVEGDITDPLALKTVDTGWIAIQDSATYAGDLTIAVPPSACLQIVAADGQRPHIQGDIAIQGWADEQMAPAELRLNGLLVEGQLTVLPGQLGQLSLQHCTLVPQVGGIRVEGDDSEDPDRDGSDFSLLAFIIYCLVALWRLIGQDLGIKTNAPAMTMAQFLQTSWQQLMAGMADVLSAKDASERTLPWGNITLTDIDNDQLEISLYRTLSGPLDLAETVPTLWIKDCVIDKGEATYSSAVAIEASGTTIGMQTTTVLGRTTAWQLEASDCLFTEKVTVQRHQEGCVRFSYVPVASKTPRRYRCQPDLALQAVLDDIPKGVTALGMMPLPPSSGGGNSSADQPYNLLAATAGNGIFGLRQPPTAEQPQPLWQDANGDLANRNLSALITYRWPRFAAQLAESAQQMEVMVGTTTGEILHLVNPSTARLTSESKAEDASATEAETSASGNSLVSESPTWRSVPLPKLNAAITSLYDDQVTGTGSMTVSNQARNDAVLAKGVETRFSQELQVGDVILVGDSPWRVEQIGRSSGSRTIILKGRTVEGTGPSFAADLAPGNTITLQRLLRSGEQQQTISQTRTITELRLAENGATLLLLNAPFGAAFETEKPHPFIVNIDTELFVKPVFPRDNGEPLEDQAFQILRLWATTDGGGLWRGSIDGQSWQPLNSGLTNLSLTTVVRDAEDQIWVGTAGGGPFRLTRTTTGDRWTPLSQGLTSSHIHQLIQSSRQELLAATDDGIFRYDPDGATWEATSEGLTVPEITTLTSYQVIGTISTHLVIAGSRDGKLFRSIDGGQTWQALELDLRGTDVTALVATGEDGDLWLGTAAGEVLRSQNHGATWQSIQAGRADLITKLQVLNQVQPSFTATHYGDPGYVQLRETCLDAIRTGAENGAEMGVFNYLRQPQQEANLKASLNEYLRFGRAAGIFYMT